MAAKWSRSVRRTARAARRPSARRWPRAPIAPFTSRKKIWPRSIRWASRNCWPAAASENPDLILTGLQSDDLGYGQTGVVVAELLGLPHATIIMQVEKMDGGIRVKRELEDGWFQHIEMPLPAVLTIQSGINKLRYATLMGIKKAKTKEIKRLTAAELGVSVAPAASHRTSLPAAAQQADADFRRRPQGSRGQAGGEAEIRGESHMRRVI